MTTLPRVLLLLSLLSFGAFALTSGERSEDRVLHQKITTLAEMRYRADQLGLAHMPVVAAPNPVAHALSLQSDMIEATKGYENASSQFQKLMGGQAVDSGWSEFRNALDAELNARAASAPLNLSVVKRTVAARNALQQQLRTAAGSLYDQASPGRDAFLSAERSRSLRQLFHVFAGVFAALSMGLLVLMRTPKSRVLWLSALRALAELRFRPARLLRRRRSEREQPRAPLQPFSGNEDVVDVEVLQQTSLPPSIKTKPPVIT